MQLYSYTKYSISKMAVQTPEMYPPAEARRGQRHLGMLGLTSAISLGGILMKILVRVAVGTLGPRGADHHQICRARPTSGA